MLRTGRLARLVMPLLIATTSETIVAGEPAVTPPPAKSIRDWNPNPGAAPAANAAAPSPAKSIRDWNPNPSAAPPANPCSTASVVPAAMPAMPAVRAVVPASPITISLTSTLREGNLVVILDDVPIFNESFQKPLLLISQTTSWDPVQIPAGQHRLAAKVYGTKKTYISALYDLNVSRTKGSALRFVMKGDKLTVEVAS